MHLYPNGVKHLVVSNLTCYSHERSSMILYFMGFERFIWGTAFIGDRCGDGRGELNDLAIIQ